MSLIHNPFSAFRFRRSNFSTINYFGNGSDGALSTPGDVIHTVLNKDGVYDGDLYVANYTSLTINNGHTMTTDQPCKGLLIYVSGSCTIDGTLTMTARGALQDPVAGGVSAAGIRLPMLGVGADTLAAADFAGCGAAAIAAVGNQVGISGDGTIFIITRTGGAAGAPSVGNGNPGGTMVNGSGGGGGGGAIACTGQAGAAGTCFCGGGGGGGCGGPGSGTAATANGGAGGDGGGQSAGGGAGNPGGAAAPIPGGTVGENGMGGILILIVNGDLNIGAAGVVSANGKNGGTGGNAGGGGSGGGNIRVLHTGSLTNNGSIEADGGIGGTNGGNGGAGSTVTAQVSR